eukprot:CAMPEP_0170541530 /NCGR_PEP_ID=MMETSP0211-20121228/1241_1 /TAXON_ID=311385 /ORGANISM="Pseudokeronopsis sp., Strain OXSARD2" /LENGTH=90 /DNA_ID=CAMNT_0010844295 /DNA_START=137 /DNA_END=409 /DNA_ORIENTATION=+
MKLNDAILRNRIRKVEKEVEELKIEQAKVEKDVKKVQKQNNTDCQYLIKQKELQERYELDLQLNDLTKFDSAQDLMAKLKAENDNLLQLQ